MHAFMVIYYLFGLLILLIGCEYLVEFNKKKDGLAVHVALMHQHRIS